MCTWKSVRENMQQLSSKINKKIKIRGVTALNVQKIINQGKH